MVIRFNHQLLIFPFLNEIIEHQCYWFINEDGVFSLCERWHQFHNVYVFILQASFGWAGLGCLIVFYVLAANRAPMAKMSPNEYLCSQIQPRDTIYLI